MIRTEKEFVENLNEALSFIPQERLKTLPGVQENSLAGLKNLTFHMFDLIQESNGKRVWIRYYSHGEWHSFLLTIEHFEGMRHPTMNFSPDQWALMAYWESQARAFDETHDVFKSQEEENPRKTGTTLETPREGGETKE